MSTCTARTDKQDTSACTAQKRPASPELLPERNAKMLRTSSSSDLSFRNCLRALNVPIRQMEPTPTRASRKFDLTSLGWPPLARDLCKEECLWIIFFLENLFGRVWKSAFAIDDDDDDAPPIRGPGRFGEFSLHYTEGGARAVPSATNLCFDRFGIDRNVEQRAIRPLEDVIDTVRVDQIASAMHTYLGDLMGCVARHVPLFASQIEQCADTSSLLEMATASRGQDDDDDALFPVASLRHLRQRLIRLHHRVSNMRVVLRGINLLASKDTQSYFLPPELIARGMRDNDDAHAARAPNERQQLLDMRLQECLVKDYRRLGNDLYREILIAGTIHTRTYKRCMSIDDFVWSMPSPVWHRSSWIRSTSNRSTPKWIADYMRTVRNDPMLVDLKRTRSQWSFRNGVYTAHDNRFWRYDKRYIDADCPFNSGNASAKFFDEEFDESLVSMSVNDIEVPGVDRILRAQNWDHDTESWAWVLFGRLFYNVGHFDNWNVAPMLFGLAGTGKSTLIDALASVYEGECVVRMESRGAFDAKIMSASDAFLCVAPAVHHDFDLSSSTLSDMVAGEPVSTDDRRWTAPVIFAGDFIPLCMRDQNIDVTFAFDTPIPETEVDSTLCHLVYHNMARFIVKANRFYRVAAYHYRTISIWKALPYSLLSNSRIGHAQAHDE